MRFPRRITSVNTTVENQHQTRLGVRTASRTGTVALPTETTKSISRSAPLDFSKQAKNVKTELPDRGLETIEAPPRRTVERLETRYQSKNSERRRLFFRCIRLAIAGALAVGGIAYSRHTLVTATSIRAYIDGEITSVRAPIAGQLVLDGIEPGQELTAGAPLFSVSNSRYGNEQTASQLIWVNELDERLQAEVEEAKVRFEQQQEVFNLNEKLFAEKLISRLAVLEEQNKLNLAKSVFESKVGLAAKASKRASEIKEQVELLRTAQVSAPFNGVVWSIRAKNGSVIGMREPIVELVDPRHIWVEAFFQERHAQKFKIGTVVDVRNAGLGTMCKGKVESIRGGGGHLSSDSVTALPAGQGGSGGIAVRIKMENGSSFQAGEFFGVGRSVVVTLASHE
jgi:multidrug resistance efflux pump